MRGGWWGASGPGGGRRGGQIPRGPVEGRVDPRAGSADRADDGSHSTAGKLGVAFHRDSVCARDGAAVGPRDVGEPEIGFLSVPGGRPADAEAARRRDRKYRGRRGGP